MTGQHYAAEQGREEGLKQGREEGTLAEKKQIAGNLKNKGLAFEIISEVTGLTIEEIEAL